MAPEVPVMSMELRRHNFFQIISLAHQPLRRPNSIFTVYIKLANNHCDFFSRNNQLKLEWSVVW